MQRSVSRERRCSQQEEATILAAVVGRPAVVQESVLPKATEVIGAVRTGGALMLPAGQFGWLWVGLQQIVETGMVVIVLRKLGVHSGRRQDGVCSSHEETWEASKRQEFSHPLC